MPSTTAVASSWHGPATVACTSRNSVSTIAAASWARAAVTTSTSRASPNSTPFAVQRLDDAVGEEHEAVTRLERQLAGLT